MNTVPQRGASSMGQRLADPALAADHADAMIDEVETLKKRLAAIADPAIRVAYIRTTLLAARADELFTLLATTIALTEAKDKEASDLLLAISIALADPSCDALRDDVATLAREQNAIDVLRAFATRTSSESSGNDEPNVPDFGKGRPLSLGERKSLARTLDRDLIARVIRDPSPDVVRILLGNPRLTEDDVVRLCARRPQAPLVLVEVFRNTKWMTRYRVRLTLAKNPNTPLDIALQIVPHLTTQDARDIARTEGLDQALRQACERSSMPPTLH